MKADGVTAVRMSFTHHLPPSPFHSPQNISGASQHSPKQLKWMGTRAA